MKNAGVCSKIRCMGVAFFLIGLIGFTGCSVRKTGTEKIRDVNASVNSFYNSMAASMGVSGYTEEDLLNLNEHEALCLIRNEDKNYSSFICKIPA